jgi:hypothetical protein
MSVIVPKEEWEAYQAAKKKKAKNDIAIDNLKVKKLTQGQPTEAVKTVPAEGALKVQTTETSAPPPPPPPPPRPPSPSSSSATSSSSELASSDSEDENVKKRQKKKTFNKKYQTHKQAFHYIKGDKKKDKASCLLEDIAMHPHFKLKAGVIKHKKSGTVLGNVHFILHKIFSHHTPPLAKNGHVALKKLVQAKLLSPQDFAAIFPQEEKSANKKPPPPSSSTSTPPSLPTSSQKKKKKKGALPSSAAPTESKKTKTVFKLKT